MTARMDNAMRIARAATLKGLPVPCEVALGCQRALRDQERGDEEAAQGEGDVHTEEAPIESAPRDTE
jgi:hypothetical protein